MNPTVFVRCHRRLSFFLRALIFDNSFSSVCVCVCRGTQMTTKNYNDSIASGQWDENDQRQRSRGGGVAGAGDRPGA